MAKGPVGKVSRDTKSDDLLKQLAEYRDKMDQQHQAQRPDLTPVREILKDQNLKPGSKAFERLKQISDRLGEVQEKDFQARQIKEEIDRLLKNAHGGGLFDAFMTKDKDDA